jgi:DNA-binding GntR family transcriptional regulator
LSTAIVDYVKTAILRGEYPPGSSLPEIPLARKMSASRATIREALRGLSDMGLVDINPRRGATVALLTPKRAREIFSLRAVLEPFALKLALTEGQLRKRELAAIDQAFDQLRRSVGDPFALIEADMGFHWSLCSPCAHDLLLEKLRSLQVRTRQFIFYTKFYDSDAEGEVEAHLPILSAVHALDAYRAEQALRDHITSAGERLLVRMSQLGVSFGVAASPDKAGEHSPTP